MSNNYSETFQTYECVHAGTYVCVQCGNQNQNGIIALKENEMLPECEECGYTTWIKVS